MSMNNLLIISIIIMKLKKKIIIYLKNIEFNGNVFDVFKDVFKYIETTNEMCLNI